MSEDETHLSILERLIRWGIEMETSNLGRLKEEGGFTHNCAYYRGIIRGYNRVLDLIEWYSLDIQSSEFKENDPLGETTNAK